MKSSPSASALWMPVAAYMGLIFALSSVSEAPSMPEGLDKEAHALLYAGLSALVVRALAGGWKERVTSGVAALAGLVATAYGVSDEFHQSFVPHRQVEALDLVADAVGATLAAAACYVWSRTRRS